MRVVDLVRALLDAGWAVDAEGLRWRRSGSLRYSVRTGLDWFDLQGGLDFEGEAPDAAALARRWRAALEAARETVALLPAEQSGRAVLTLEGVPYRGAPAALRETRNELLYHEGRIRGAFPRILR